MPEPTRSIAASPNVRGESLRTAPVGGLGPSLGAIGSSTSTVLIAASKFWPEITCTLSQQGNFEFASHSAPGEPELGWIQRWKPSTGFVPPLARSYLIRMSPGLRIGVLPLALSVVSWLSSKSKFVVPDGSTIRSQAR